MLRTFFIAALSFFALPSSAFTLTDTGIQRNVNYARFVVDVSQMADSPATAKTTTYGPSVVSPEQREEESCSCKSCDCGVEQGKEDGDGGSAYDIGAMSISDLNSLTLRLEEQFTLPDGATLEEARSIVWDHIQQAPPSSSLGGPCCAEYPFCPCPKI